MYRTDFWILWEKARVGCFEITALKHVYYLGWNRSPAQVGCMRQVLGAGALGRPRGMGWGGRQERGSGWGIHVNPWLTHVNVWQKPLQYCKVISLQLIKINEKKKNNFGQTFDFFERNSHLPFVGRKSTNSTVSPSHGNRIGCQRSHNSPLSSLLKEWFSGFEVCCVFPSLKLLENMFLWPWELEPYGKCSIFPLWNLSSCSLKPGRKTQ